MSGGRAVSEVLFLHGYTTPGDPDAEVISHAFATQGMPVTVTAPTAPAGRSRLDPFNPYGRASWFRYSTDNTDRLPQGLDLARPEDVREVLHQSGGLVDLLGELVDRATASQVAVVGESQGGVMAAALTVLWNDVHPQEHLGALGLVRTAPDPLTWRDLRETNEGGTWPALGERLPPRFDTRIAMVLGADDRVFRPYTSLYASSPLWENNPIARSALVPENSSADGNTRLAILPGVTHGNETGLVFDTLAALVAAD